MKTQVHVVGAGGIGVVLAWSLARAGWDVTLVERRSDKIASGQAEGLVVAGQAAVKLPFVGFADWQPPAHAVVLLCTKTYDNRAVLARLTTTHRLVPVQNGYDTALDSSDFAGEGIASFVSECERERPAARITRSGSLHIGARREATAEERGELASLAGAFGQAGLFKVVLVGDVRPFKATKLMYNAAISPLAAAAGVDNAALLTDALAKRLFFGLLLENYAVLRHAGLALAKIGPFHPDTVARILRTPGLPDLMAIFFRPSLRGTYCSMAPDVGRGETEIDAYNGHLVRLAGNFPCPLNRAAVRLITRITREGTMPQRRHLDDMAADVQSQGSLA
ncbi:MAG TPA: FAD-dependent oxidoreductase [Candidatus Acidoferrum sp.]|nr:FAD-dependent oxidoreductase [Candidatus Acidoferrum sp.]